MSNINSMKINIKTGMMVAAVTIVTAISSLSCKKDFLNVTDPHVFSADNFPATVADINLELNDLYGRMRDGYYSAEMYAFMSLSRDHSTDLNYSRDDFNAAGKLDFLSSNNDVNRLWNHHYESIAKCVTTLNDIDRFKIKNPNLGVADKGALDLIEGQARFIRAWNYMVLVNFFGETMITSEGDKAKMGVPIITKLATSVAETQIPRSSIGEVWDYIVTDLKAAEVVLGNKTWAGNDVARVSGWAVKGMLGKAYIFTQQWSLASTKLKEVVDGSGKSLVPFEQYKEMFNGKFEFNQESLFELNYRTDIENPYGADGIGNHLSLLTSTAYINGDGDYATNGYANYFIHDKNLTRFGFMGTAITPEDMQDQDYLDVSETARNDKTTDPRLWVVAYQPYLDFITWDNEPKAVAKMRGSGVSTEDLKAWSWRKYVLTDKYIYNGNIGNGNNMFVLRLADIYLLYAEALVKTGNTADALEYINKVHRRAYDQPVNSPSTFDYASLSAATKAGDAALINDPLKYERWAEMFGEGTWWFDVSRWKLGASEAAYYEKLTVGTLVWKEKNYALPIPSLEILNNKLAKQNSGY